jgi:hypothetical protein
MPEIVIILLANVLMACAVGKMEAGVGPSDDTDDSATAAKTREECCCSWLR